jgi:high-affinity iron transporter
MSISESNRRFLSGVAAMSKALPRLPGRHLRFIILMLIGLTLPIGAFAQTRNDPATVQTAWRLLDYLAVDYGGAVADGKVKSPSEYAEMSEFSASVQTRLGTLSPSPAKAALITKADELKASIASKASPGAVAALAHGLAADLLAAYPVPLAPISPPDLGKGAALYKDNCAGCHGMNGEGMGPDAAKLHPRPIAFADAARARQRSAFGLYQVISQGLDGTPMRSFSELAAQDRWALAFYAGRFAFSEERAREGERLWKTDAAVRQAIPDMVTLAGLTPAALAAKIGDDKANALTAYLRRNPDAVTKSGAGSLSLTRTKLAESLKAYAAGNREAAEELALAAYLDGFEPVESVLRSRDADLMTRIEGAMGEVRAAIHSGKPLAEVTGQVQKLDALFADAEAALAPDQASDASTFLGAFTILLREGIEALLIVVAMIAFLRKAERGDALRYVHGGWIAALLAGLLTWFTATYFIGVSGASRELTEGFGSLFAAIVLLSVGLWMHGKSQAGQWQKYINEKLSVALSKRSAWFLFALAFLVAYREVFETILFFIALWTQGNGSWILGGAGAGILSLGIIAWVMLRYSQKLPIEKFFAYSSALIAVLTIVLAGKGVAALQEAGMIGIEPLAGFPHITMLGMFPSLQTVIAQLLALAAVIAGYFFNRGKAAAFLASQAV